MRKIIALSLLLGTSISATASSPRTPKLLSIYSKCGQESTPHQVVDTRAGYITFYKWKRSAGEFRPEIPDRIVARLNGQTLTIQFQVGTNGTVECTHAFLDHAPKLSSQQTAQLRDSIDTAVKGWRFEPYEYHGMKKAIEGQFKFKIENGRLLDDFEINNVRRPE